MSDMKQGPGRKLKLIEFEWLTGRKRIGGIMLLPLCVLTFESMIYSYPTYRYKLWIGWLCFSLVIHFHRKVK